MKDRVNAHVYTSIKANLIHLLFVKYDKNPEKAYKILEKASELGVSLNFIDQMQTAPIHIALRKRQYQAIRDAVTLNTKFNRPVFDLNLWDKKGATPLHFAVEK